MLMRFYGVVSAFIALLEVLNLSKVSIDWDSRLYLVVPS